METPVVNEETIESETKEMRKINKEPHCNRNHCNNYS